MKIYIHRGFLKLFFVLIALSSIGNLVSGVAIGGIYSQNNPLEIYPGETKLIQFNLQNLAGDFDVKFKANVTEGSEIVSLVDENPEYLVPKGIRDVPVSVRVEIPEDIGVGKEYQVKIEFEPIPVEDEGEEEMVQITLGLSRYFKIKVIGKLPEEKPVRIIWIIFSIVAVIAVIAVLWFIVKSMKDSSAEKSMTAK